MNSVQPPSPFPIVHPRPSSSLLLLAPRLFLFSLVIQTSFLGDVVLTTPLLTKLARRGPVDIVVTPAAAPLLAGHSAVRDVIVFDKRRADAGFGGLLGAARRLRGRKRTLPYDAAYLAQSSLRSAALARLSGIRRRVGFARAAGRFLQTESVVAPTSAHHAERLWRLAFGAHAPVDAAAMPAPSLNPGVAERTAVDALLAGETRPLFALAPGSAWATKRWPHFVALAGNLAAQGRIVVIGGADDAALAGEIRARVPNAIVAVGALSLLASAELIRRSRVLVTNDSLPTHLASAMGTPTVTIFGPTSPEFGFGPLAPRSRVAQLETLACRPCHHHGPRVCPLGHWRCMQDLDAARVAEIARAVADG